MEGKACMHASDGSKATCASTCAQHLLISILFVGFVCNLGGIPHMLTGILVVSYHHSPLLLISFLFSLSLIPLPKCQSPSAQPKPFPSLINICVVDFIPPSFHFISPLSRAHTHTHNTKRAYSLLSPVPLPKYQTPPAQPK